MKKPTLAQLNKAHTIEDLNALGMGKVTYEIGYRGGHLGFRAFDIMEVLGVEEGDLPRGYGAYVNYLGGGVRGSITASGFNRETITGAKAKWLNVLALACIRVYENAEGDMNNEQDEDGEPNWDAMATNKARKHGIKSAY